MILSPTLLYNENLEDPKEVKNTMDYSVCWLQISLLPNEQKIYQERKYFFFFILSEKVPSIEFLVSKKPSYFDYYEFTYFVTFQNIYFVT